MSRKRILILTAVIAVLAALVYFQFRTWRRFDWETFRNVTSDVTQFRGLWHILIAVILIYLTYCLRALRWKILLKPVCRARLASLIPTHFIGFTGLALLGRPGELIRPYLIAKKENLTFSSQIAVWTLERIFDIGAFAVLMSIDVFAFGDRLPHTAALRELGIALLAIVALMGLGAGLIRRRSGAIADWLEPRLASFSQKVSRSVCTKIRSFSEGLQAIRDVGSLTQLAAVSLLIWFLIALSYRYVMHAYPQPVLHSMHVPHVVLLMASSMVGSLIQLPAVGGGSQLAVISMLSSHEWFGVPRELAVSAGILLWLVTFMAVVPVGLAFSHHAHISLRKLTEETEEVVQQPAPVPSNID
jgi:uncharacterized protein (TIRG00374 family)